MTGERLTHVLITVDVESGIRGRPRDQIWGRVDGASEPFGIDKIMDVLDSRGVKGTFFLTPYEAADYGEEEIAGIARRIHERGHDLQLHTHPKVMFGFHDMSDAAIGDQIEVLRKGREMLERWSGKTVIAHRAGAYGANLDTIAACARMGLAVDASFCPAVPTALSGQLAPTNRWFRRDGVVMLPVTYYAQARLGTRRFHRILDLEASSLRELKNVVRQARDLSLESVNVMMHSFSLVRYGRPDRGTLRRFERLLDFLVDEPGIAVSTVSSFFEIVRDRPAPSAGPGERPPYTGWWLTYLRALEDIDKGRVNWVIGLAPLILLLLAVVAAVIALR